MAKKAPWIISAATVCVLAAGGGGTAFAMSDQAQMSVYGEQSTVRTFSPTVAELLEAQGVEVSETDLVTPSLDTEVTDGINISIQERRPVTVTVDGEPQEILTTGTTVEEAIADVEFPREKATISPAPETELEADGNTVDIVTRKSITFKGQYGEVTFGVNALTVGEAMDSVLTDVEKTDRTSVPRDTKIDDGMTVTVKRVRVTNETVKEDIPFKTKTVEDDSLEEGTTKVKTEGKKGTLQKKLEQKTVDGKAGEEKVIDERVLEEPTDEVVLKGTKEPEPVEEESSSSDDSSSGDSGSDSSSSSTESSTGSKESDDSGDSGSSSAPSASSGGVWDKLAGCESGGNWSINTGNGYYGGLQFSSSTWLAFGGGTYAQTADKASRSEQIDIAKKVQAEQGWGAWPSCTSKLGIR